MAEQQVTRVWLAGDWTREVALRKALIGSDVRVVGEGMPHGRALDVVLFACKGEVVPHGAIAAMREHTAAPIVILAEQGTRSFLEESLAAGIADVLLLPQPVENIVFAAAKADHAAKASAAVVDEGPAAQVVTAFSPKGGTGKSVTACNLGVLFASLGKRTLLVDLDLQFGDVAIMLGLQPTRTLHDVASAAMGSLDAEKLAGYAVRHASGLDVLAAPLRPEDAESIGEEAISRLLEVARRAYDVIVIDTAPILHGPMLAALDRTDELLLVATPDVPTLKNVRLTLQTLELLALPPERVRLVLNRSRSRIGFSPNDVATVMERPVDFELPEDDTVAIGVNQGTPAVLIRQAAPFPQAALSLAEALLGRSTPAPAAERPSLLTSLRIR
jgi:pilus assembly protein CpaE